MMISRTNNSSQVVVPPPVDGASETTARVSASFATSGADGSTSILPDPQHQLASGGDVLLELVTLLTLASQGDRDAARKEERMEDVARTQQENQKVAAMHQEAADIRAGAWAEGLADIGQGACQIGAGTTTAVCGKLDANDAFLASSKGFEAAGRIVGGRYSATQKLDQAGEAQAGANADRAGRGAKEASDDVDSAREMLKKIASFYEQMLQAKSASMNAAVNWRG